MPTSDQAPAEETDFKLSRDPTGRYIQLLQKGGADTLNAEFDAEEVSGIHDDGYLFSLGQAIYEVVADDYDVIAFVGNDQTTQVPNLLARRFRSVTMWLAWGSQSGLQRAVTAQLDAFGVLFLFQPWTTF